MIIIIIINVSLRRKEMDYSLCVCIVYLCEGKWVLVLGRRVEE